MIYFLGLGSNLGDCKANLRRALKLIEEKKLGEVKARSHLYLTEPVGGHEQPWYLNAVAEIESKLKPEQMMSSLLSIEAEMGRKRNPSQKNFPRTIDLDILLAGDKIIQTEKLTVPHPRMALRRFALAPLVEVAGDIIHPLLKKSLREILAGLEDSSQVKKLDEIL